MSYSRIIVLCVLVALLASPTSNGSIGCPIDVLHTPNVATTVGWVGATVRSASVPFRVCGPCPSLYLRIRRNSVETNTCRSCMVCCCCCRCRRRVCKSVRQRHKEMEPVSMCVCAMKNCRNRPPSSLSASS